MSTSRTTRSAWPAAATSGSGTSRRRTSSSATTTWSSSVARISAACCTRSSRRRSTSSRAYGSTSTRGRAICRGPRRFEGTLDVEDGVLVHRLGATRGTADGLPVFDVVHQFFVAARERLGPDPWDPELNLSEHYELFLTLRSAACARRGCPTSSSSTGRSCRPATTRYAWTLGATSTPGWRSEG